MAFGNFIAYVLKINDVRIVYANDIPGRLRRHTSKLEGKFSSSLNTNSKYFKRSSLAVDFMNRRRIGNETKEVS